MNEGIIHLDLDTWIVYIYIYSAGAYHFLLPWLFAPARAVVCHPLHCTGCEVNPARCGEVFVVWLRAKHPLLIVQQIPLLKVEGLKGPCQSSSSHPHQQQTRPASSAHPYYLHRISSSVPCMRLGCLASDSYPGRPGWPFSPP